jgi:AcrR family transcriptional regulator
MDRRDEFLDAAERVLRKRGLSGTTTRAITTEVGCAEGTLYRYFADRAELFLALFERRLVAALPALQRLSELAERSDPQAVLLDVCMEFLRFHRENAAFLAGLFAEPDLLKKYRALILRKHDAQRVSPPLLKYVRHQQRAGRIAADADPAVITEALVGTCFARAFHDLMFDDRPTEAADRKFLSALIGSLTGAGRRPVG